MHPSIRLSRAAVVAACSLSLALPTHVRAQEPAADATEQLDPQAEKHITKALAAYGSQSYSNAEAEFKRAAFFTPNWRPLHFNMAVLAEAQGKIGSAIYEYKAFKPFATPDESIVVDQRIYELDQRRRFIGKLYRKQIIGGSVAMVVAAGALAGGGVFIYYYVDNNRQISSLKDQNGMLQMLNAAGEFNQNLQDQFDMNSAEITSRGAKKEKLLYGAVWALILGFGLAAFAAIPLSRSIKSKRQLEGITLGPTRFKINSGGVTLRF